MLMVSIKSTTLDQQPEHVHKIYYHRTYETRELFGFLHPLQTHSSDWPAIRRIGVATVIS